MDPHTLTLYVIAASLSFCLALILVTFAHFLPSTVVTRSSAAAMLVLAVAFFAAGYGPLLPRWMTVMGTNMVLIAAGAIFYPGFAAYCGQGSPTLDRFGWAVVAMTALPFGYWGLVEPNGVYRSIVFSFAAAAVNVRTAVLLIRLGGKNPGGWPTLALGVVFATITLWMFTRGVLLLNAEPALPPQRGSNPTSWVTVFWYIVLVALMTACILWMEINRLKAPHRDMGHTKPGAVETSRGNRILLWSVVTILNVAIISEVGIAYQALYQTETERLHKLGMATGFSDAEVRQHVLERIQPIALGALLTVLAIFTLAAILMSVIRQRDEQDRFMSMLSHELKTPLSVLRMALGSETLHARVRQHAIRSVEDINAVIDRCLQVDRLHHGRLALHREPCQMGAILSELHFHSADPDRLVLQIADLPECKTDRQIMQIILSNLIDNALKYGAPDQAVRIVAAPTTQRGNPGIAVTVTNTVGLAGFPDARKVFEKYYRAAGAHSKTGSGLGLYLAANLARFIDGRLRYLPSDQDVSFELWTPL